MHWVTNRYGGLSWACKLPRDECGICGARRTLIRSETISLVCGGSVKHMNATTILAAMALVIATTFPHPSYAVSVMGYVDSSSADGVFSGWACPVGWTLPEGGVPVRVVAADGTVLTVGQTVIPRPDVVAAGLCAGYATTGFRTVPIPPGLMTKYVGQTVTVVAGLAASSSMSATLPRSNAGVSFVLSGANVDCHGTYSYCFTYQDSCRGGLGTLTIPSVASGGTFAGTMVDASGVSKTANGKCAYGSITFQWQANNAQVLIGRYNLPPFSFSNNGTTVGGATMLFPAVSGAGTVLVVKPKSATNAN